MKTSIAAIPPYVTRDGSQIRELLHPDHHPVRRQSLAEAVVMPGQATQLHLLCCCAPPYSHEDTELL